MKLIVSMMIVSGWFAFGKAQRFDFNSQIGVVDGYEDGRLCLIISNPNLGNGAVISLVFLSNPQWVARATIKERLDQSCSYNPDTGDASFYLLRLDGKNKTFRMKDSRAAAIAVVSTARVEVRRGKARLDLDKDGRGEFFRECTSNEGLHLTVWTGKPLQGKRRWHFYYYLGYDVEPSCKRKDYL